MIYFRKAKNINDYDDYNAKPLKSSVYIRYSLMY